MGLGSSLKHAWNAFRNDEQQSDLQSYGNYGASFGLRPDRPRYNLGNERSIISSIYTRLAIDVAAISIKHVRLDENGRFTGTMKSGLNECLNVEANLDQDGRALRQDAAMTLFDKGVIAIVPIETDLNPIETGGYDIKNLRVGNVVAWYPEHVRIDVYNEKLGRRVELVVPKTIVAIIENPLYSVMNEQNSTLQRLIRKLNLLDAIDEQSGSGKLDLIIQLPYVIKTEERRKQAESRRKDIEMQLKDSKYGVAYTDGTEHITQLNRPSENNMLKQVEYLTSMLYSQLGLTQSIFDGTADEKTMLNYYNRTIEPILTAITDGMKRKFLTKTARSQGQSLEFFRDPFKLVPISQLADIADKLSRNEIATPNEIRGIIGWMPADDPKADKLINSNMPQPAPAVDPGMQDQQPLQLTAQRVADPQQMAITQ